MTLNVWSKLENHSKLDDFKIKGAAGDAPLLAWSNIFYLHIFFGKNWSSNRLAPPPKLGGSATGSNLPF